MNIKYYLQHDRDETYICNTCPFKNQKVVHCKSNCKFANFANCGNIIEHYLIQINNTTKYVVRYKEENNEH